MPDGSVGAAGMAGGAVGQVQSVFGGSVMGAAKSMIGGGGFEFSPEELEGVIKEWEDLLEELQDDSQELGRIKIAATPPAEDVASVGFVNAVVDGLNEAHESNQSMVAYVEDYIAKLKAAKAGNEEVDAANAGAVGSFLDSEQA